MDEFIAPAPLRACMKALGIGFCAHSKKVSRSAAKNAVWSPENAGC
jgi:hypothetical protein